MRKLLFVLVLIAACFHAEAQTPSICSVTPPAGSPSRIYRDGSRLCWNGRPLRMVGYGTTDVATRDGYDFARFFNTIRFTGNPDPRRRHGVNFTRIWAMGTANSPDCRHTDAGHDPRQSPMTMPFPFLPGETCAPNRPYPKYNMCIGNYACAEDAGLNPAYVTRMQSVLSEARRNGILVEFMLFDAYYMGRHNFDQEALFAKNPWNPLHNNMGQNRFRRSAGSNTFAACNMLPRLTDTSDARDDAFPEFYEVCSDTTSTERCDRTLNCLGMIQKGYVEAMVDLVRQTPGGGDHVFFQIMNRPTFDKNDSNKEGFNLTKFKRWNDLVGYWIKCRGDNNCSNTRGDYLVLGEVGLAEHRDLSCSKPQDCPVNPLDAMAMPNIDIVNFQGFTWINSPGAPGACKTAMMALNKFHKPVIIDTDSAYDRVDKCAVERWASQLRACGSIGQVHFNHLDGMTFGYPEPRSCSFRGIGTREIKEDFDERYLDCHTLDTIAAGEPTYLSDIVTTAPPQSCPSSVSATGNPVWCATSCAGSR